MRGVGRLVSGVETVLITVIVYLFIQGFVAQPFRIEQRSMESTLSDGQYVLVDKLSPQFDAYSRGDIVVFHPGAALGGDPTPLIKRVIGVGGDVVQIHSGRVWVNGTALDEADYVTAPDGTEPTSGHDAVWEVPTGSVFVLGDHRDRSTDSRDPQVGLVPVRSIIGRAVVRYWPLSAFGVLPTPSYDAPSAAGGPDPTDLTLRARP